MGATVHLGGCKNSRDEIKVKIWIEISMFEEALCEMVCLLYLNIFIGINIVPDWEMLPLFSVVKQKAYKSTLPPTLIGCTSRPK